MCNPNELLRQEKAWHSEISSSAIRGSNCMLGLDFLWFELTLR